MYVFESSRPVEFVKSAESISFHISYAHYSKTSHRGKYLFGELSKLKFPVRFNNVILRIPLAH